jgi:hypothetical protein
MESSSGGLQRMLCSQGQDIRRRGGFAAAKLEIRDDFCIHSQLVTFSG